MQKTFSVLIVINVQQEFSTPYLRVLVLFSLSTYALNYTSLSIANSHILPKNFKYFCGHQEINTIMKLRFYGLVDLNSLLL